MTAADRPWREGPAAAKRDQAAGPASQRLLGIDMARAVAVVGMVAVHVGPVDVYSIGGRLYALSHGRASILFVLLAGLGVALLSSRTSSHTDARLRLVSFALVLLPLGLVLQEFGGRIAVILHHYAAFFLFGCLVLGLPRRLLLGLALAMTVLGPLLYLSVGTLDPDFVTRQTVAITDGPLAVAAGLLISGPYPLVVWCVPLLWGMWLGRGNIRATKTHLRLCMGGAALAIAATAASMFLTATLGEPDTKLDWHQLLVAGPHSQMPLWLLAGIGSAMFVLGAALLVAGRFQGIVQPFVAMGQLALTTYVAHVLALQWWREALTHDVVMPSVATVTLLTAVAMLFAIAWRSVFARGPLEAVVHLPWHLIERTLGGSPIRT